MYFYRSFLDALANEMYRCLYWLPGERGPSCGTRSESVPSPQFQKSFSAKLAIERIDESHGRRRTFKRSGTLHKLLK